MTRVRIGMAQICVDDGQPEANLARAVERIEQAAREGCEVVVLPECLDLGWTHPSARTLAEPIPGPRTDRLVEAARAGRIHVVAGLVERNGDQLYNAAVFLSPAGDLLLKHRKINELDIALDLYARGESLAVVRSAIGTVGIPICADNFPGTLFYARSLVGMGAQLLLSPCAWAVPPEFDNEKTLYGGLWIDAYSTLAKEHPVVVVGVSNVGQMTAGPWKGHRCIGRSLAVGPGGEILAHLPFGDAAEAFAAIDVALP